MYLNNLFVYGTLLPGLENYKRFLEKHNPKYYEAKARGIMYYLPEDNYPVVIEGNGEVKGVLFQMDNLNDVLPFLDEIEEYTGVDSQSYLIREIKEVEIVNTGEKVKAHMFLWPLDRKEQLEKEGEIINDGDWKKFLESKK